MAMKHLITEAYDTPLASEERAPQSATAPTAQKCSGWARAPILQEALRKREPRRVVSNVLVEEEVNVSGV